MAHGRRAPFFERTVVPTTLECQDAGDEGLQCIGLKLVVKSKDGASRARSSGRVGLALDVHHLSSRRDKQYRAPPTMPLSFTVADLAMELGLEDDHDGLDSDSDSSSDSSDDARGWARFAELNKAPLMESTAFYVGDEQPLVLLALSF